VRRALLPITLPLSWLYGLGVRYRNRRYDSEAASIRRLEVPVVSVGNVTVGGSGKTPFVAALARRLLDQGRRVAVLSRGYGRKSRADFVLVSDGSNLLAAAEESGDEPFELATHVSGLVVAVGPDRFEIGRRIVEKLAPEVILLDDGFQHRRLHRDLDLVCFDGGEPEAALRLLPAGRLREPLSSLERADALVWMRWKEGASLLRTSLPTIRAVTTVSGFTRLDEGAERVDAKAFAETPVGVTVGLARPERVLEGLSARVVCFEPRRDHFQWTRGELVEVVAKARARGAEAVLTTGKDAAKIGPLLHEAGPALALPIYEIGIETEILDHETLDGLVARVLSP
jgi:tetraacyldisaccharide 4'-kinase